MDGQPAQPVSGQNPAQKPSNQATSQPEKSTASGGIDKEILSDLTVGLPTPQRLLEESLMLMKHKFFQFIIVLAIPLLLSRLLFMLPLLFKGLPAIVELLMQGIIAFIAFMLITFGYLALLFAIKDNEQNISLLQAYKRAAKYIGKLWKLLFLATVLVATGCIAFIIPGAIFGVWFSIAIFVLIVEDLSGMDALLQSKGYVEKYWIAVLGRWLFIGLFASLVYLPFYLLGKIPLPIVFETLHIWYILIIVPVVSIFGFLVYGNLRVLRGDTTAYVAVLKSSNSTKQKLAVFSPSFYKGAMLGFPLVVYLFYTFMLRPYLIQGDSMTPSYAENELVLTSVLMQDGMEIRRGDVIILNSPVDSDAKVIKRIIGMPGESIVIRNGKVVVNDQMLDESSYLGDSVVTKNGPFLQEGYVFTILHGHYIVMGDNREKSGDSREWGPIRRSDIIGKAGMCLWGCPQERKK